MVRRTNCNIRTPQTFVKSVFWINDIGVTDDAANLLMQRNNPAFCMAPADVLC